MTGLFSAAPECAVLTFAAVAVGAESAAQQIVWADSVDSGVNSTGANFIRGMRLELTNATPGIITARVYDGDPAVTRILIYEANFDFATVTVLTDMLGDEAVDCFNDPYMTLQSDTAAMDISARPVVAQGSLVVSTI
jgi:hypothetical protein